LHKHEKAAFLKFFIAYFASIAPLILAAGFFYYIQMKNHLLKAEEFSLIEYARHIKMHTNLQEYKNSSFHYHYTPIIQKHIDIRNFTIGKKELSKFIPVINKKYYLEVFKSKQNFENTMWNLKIKIIALQIFLLLLFAYISYRLAKSALKPLQESIDTLDTFAKDLIHDLNTPVTSIKLNMKLLEKNGALTQYIPLQRIEKSVQTITELHQNLTLLLQEETFQLQEINVCKVVTELVQVEKELHPNITFQVECSSLQAKLNRLALKQILQNLFSNACKHNTANGYVKIYSERNRLIIQNSGNSIENPQQIFQRSYSGDNKSSGIGLDIVNRLVKAMDISIEVKSQNGENSFILTMP